MRKSFLTAVVLATGVIGFAAASPAGVAFRDGQPAVKTARNGDLASKYAGANCRIERSMGVDFHGNPCMKKVRICA